MEHYPSQTFYTTKREKAGIVETADLDLCVLGLLKCLISCGRLFYVERGDTLVRRSLVFLVLLLCFAGNMTVRDQVVGDSAMAILVNPATIDVAVGTTFEVTIDICNAAGVNSWEIFLYFDPAIIKLSNYASGGFLEWFGSVSSLLLLDESILGYVEAGQSLMPLTQEGASGNGTLIILVFAVVGMGNSSLHLSNTALYDYLSNPMTHTTTDGFLSAHSELAKTIFVRSDGSLDPDTAPIQIDGSVYTLTANLVADVNFSGIVIERDGVTLDGASHVLQGDQWSGNAVTLSGRSNVTIRNVNINGFLVGVLLEDCSASGLSCNNMEMCGHAGVLMSCSNCSSITGNSLYTCGNGITLDASFDNSVLGNNVSACKNKGLLLNSSANCMVKENRLKGCLGSGALLAYSSNVTLVLNELLANHVGVYVYESSGNLVYHNNFIGNGRWDVQIGTANCMNKWDDGYPSGGNFYLGYNWTDFYGGSYQNVTGADGINDVPYVFDECNRDNYPLMKEVTVNEFHSVFLIPILGLSAFVTIAFLKKKRRAFRASNSGIISVMCTQLPPNLTLCLSIIVMFFLRSSKHALSRFASCLDMPCCTSCCSKAFLVLPTLLPKVRYIQKRLRDIRVKYGEDFITDVTTEAALIFSTCHLGKGGGYSSSSFSF
jgi:parallel beta-helix repeat protein